MKRPALPLLILGHLWALPCTLLMLLLGLVYRAHGWRWSDGCLEALGGRRPDGETRIWGRPGAQTIGGVIYYASEGHRRDPELRVHERVHVVHFFLLGVLMALAYGLHFLWLFAFATPAEPVGEPRWRRAYLRIWSERIAYRVQAEVEAGARPGAWGSLEET